MKEIINGCGSKWAILKPPYAIMFEASCNIHDTNYHIWWTAKDRLKADIWLAKYMGRDVRRLANWKQLYFYLWVFLYYFAVRLFGWKHFNYKKSCKNSKNS